MARLRKFIQPRTWPVIVLIFVLIIVVIGFWAVRTYQLEDVTTSQFATENIATTAPDDITQKPVLSFSTVTQEFWYTDEAIETINRMIDIHEQYDVPLDVIVDDASIQVYASKAPAVIERLKNSSVVAVSYHIRAPRPYFQRFDFAGLSDLSEEGLYDALKKYEEYAVDLETGETTEAPGGFQFVKDVVGYPPVMSGLNTDLQFTSALAQVYKDKGTQMFIRHGDRIFNVGDTAFGLPVRPETLPTILSEYYGKSAESIIGDRLTEAELPAFMTIKTHDNDFIATQAAWLSIYTNQPGRGTPRPPFDLSVHDEYSDLLSDEEREARWTQYKELVQYAAAHRDEYILANAFDIVAFSKQDDTDGQVASSVAVDNTNAGGEGVPPIYITVVSHNEEPVSGRYPNFVEDEDAFWTHRNAVLDFATRLHERGVHYDWQSDWNFLQAVLKYDNGTAETKGKNMVRYLYEDLDVSIDAHAHESTYNYADVGYLIEQLGVPVNGVVGGFKLLPPGESKLEYLQQTIRGNIYKDYEWQPQILWGGASIGHQNDPVVAGVWRPSSAEAYTTDGGDDRLPYVGGFTGNWDGVDYLLEQQQKGELQNRGMYVANIMINQDEITDYDFRNTFMNTLDTYLDYSREGALRWVTLVDVIRIWQDEYGSQPTIYIGPTNLKASNQNTPTQGVQKNSGIVSPTNGVSNFNRDKCGNGICEPVEGRLGSCSTDCS